MRSLHVVLALAVGTSACAGRLSIGAGARVSAPPPPTFRASVHVDVSFFGVPLADAQDVVFLLDRSGSMGGVAAGFAGSDAGMGAGTALLTSLGTSIANDALDGPLPTKLEAAQAELVRTLTAMPDGTRFSIVFFDDEIAALSPTLVTLDAGSRAQATAFVRAIRPGGGTAAVPALRLAYGAGAARVILLTDGLANTGGGTDALLADARAQIAAGVRFDTVGVGIDQDAALLRTLATEGGGITVVR